MTDAVAFMRWERVVPWKILSLKVHPSEIPFPVGFGSNSKEFARNLHPGSQIWVVTRIAKQYSLAGRVDVKEILHGESMPRSHWPEEVADLLEQWRFVARSKAHSNSSFFETNIAQSAVSGLPVKFARGRTIIYNNGPLDNAFQACMDQGRETVFLSYHWKEAKPFARLLANKLRRFGLSPWLDTMALPKYQEKGDLGQNEQRLVKLVERGIDESKLVAIINTPTYGRSCWTQVEMKYIQSKGARWVQVMRGGSIITCEEPPIVHKKVDDVAQEILTRFMHR